MKAKWTGVGQRIKRRDRNLGFRAFTAFLAWAIALQVAALSANAGIIAFEDFDGGALNLTGTQNVFDFGSGGGSGGDVFGRVSRWNGGTGTGMPSDVADDSVIDVSGLGAAPGDTLGLAGQHTSAFFALNDMDGADVPKFTNATWTFDISAATSIDSITIDLAALGDFEAAAKDGFLIAAQIDGGGFQDIFWAKTDESASKSYRPFDGGFVFASDDPLALFIDGSGAATGFLDKSDAGTGKFDTYTSLRFAGDSGSTLDVRVSWAGTPSGFEPMGLDNITVNGQGVAVVPLPTSALLAAVGILVSGAFRRRTHLEKLLSE